MNPNIAARLVEVAARHPTKPAIIEERRGRATTIAFGDLARRVEETSAAMRGDGIVAGDRILLFVPMSIDLYVALLATFHAGATAVFVDAWADRRRLEAAVALAHPALLVAPPPVHLLRLIIPSLRRIPRRWMAGRRALRLARHRRPGGAAAPVSVDADSAALITFTTGSTGAPKAAPRSHALLQAQHEALAEHLQLLPADVDMPTLPIFVLNNLALGITSVLPDFDPQRPAEIDPPRILAQMSRHGVTTSSGSPAFYARLADWCAARGETLPLRLWTGGAPVYPPLARQLDGLTGGGAHVVYGSTEAEPIAGIGAGEMVRVMAESQEAGICCGVPVPAVELRIIRPVDGPVELGPRGWAEWEVEPGETGEIVVAGAHVLGEYLHAPAETRRHKIREGSRVWHRTGDAGHLDAARRVWLMGRVSSRIVRGGVAWWSTPAEVRALEVPGVRHAAYLGVDDPGGTRALLCVEGSLPADAEVRLRAALAPIPVDEVVLLEHIPRDPRHASKTDVERLRRLLAGRLGIHREEREGREER